MNEMKTRNTILYLLIAYFFIKVLFMAFSFPIFYGPDESEHVAYLEYIYNNKSRGYYEGRKNTSAKISDNLTKSFSVLKFGLQDYGIEGLYKHEHSNLELKDIVMSSKYYRQNVEGKQTGITTTAHPIFYYITLLPLWSVIDNFNLDVYSAVILLRVFNVIIGILCLFIFYLNLNILFRGCSKYYSYIGLLFLVFNPTFSHVCSIVGNDAVLFLITNLLFYLYFNIKPKLYYLIIIAIVLGAGFNTKLFFVPIGLTTTIFTLYYILHRARFTTKNRLIFFLSFTSVLLLISIPWYLQNYFYFQKTIGFDLTSNVSSLVHNVSIFKFIFIEKFPGLIYRHFWGLFSWGDFAISGKPYFLIIVLTILAFVGLIINFVRCLKRKLKEKKYFININNNIALLFAGTLIFIFALSYNLYLNYKSHGALVSGLHGRYYFSAFLAYSYLMSLGLINILRQTKLTVNLLIIVLFYIDLKTTFELVNLYYYG
jgi:hypothetical protein